MSNIRWAISPQGCPFRRKLEKWYQDEEESLDKYMEISSLDTLLSSVREGITSTLLPKSVLTDTYKDLYVKEVPKPYRYIETGLIRLDEKYASQAYKAFADLVNKKGL